MLGDKSYFNGKDI